MCELNTDFFKDLDTINDYIKDRYYPNLVISLKVFGDQSGNLSVSNLSNIMDDDIIVTSFSSRETMIFTIDKLANNIRKGKLPLFRLSVQFIADHLKSFIGE